ncbi:MAG: hypothetical protein C4K47_09095 [Candidatus Thorarchaeota archaeon]|nr:MAG: hypothetical protein C4K47_09095 [Candidatus Thorarchaeota archaeon]
MKRALQVLIALAISSLFLASPVSAASNQGLSWGVQLHDRLNYTLAVNNATFHMSEAFYLNVTADPPAIPDSMTLLSQVPTVDLDAWWTNGTEMQIEYAILFWVLVDLPFGTGVVLPIGNFTLLEQLVQTYILWSSSTVFVGDSQSWGMKLVQAHPGYNSTLEATYQRNDGALATVSATSTNNTSHATIGSLQITRGLPLDIIGWIRENILMVGAGVLVVVIVGAVVCMKRK